MTRCEFLPATRDLAERYYGRSPPFTFRGYVAVLEGEPVGVGGIFYHGDMPIAFSEMKDEMRPRLKDRARAVRVLEQQFKGHRSTLYAVQDEREPTSAGLLPRLGFVPTGQAIEYGPLWVREG